MARAQKKDFFQKLAKRLRHPRQVQNFIRTIPYNMQDTQYSAREAIRRNRLHCLESSFVAAAILEHHGYPPLVVSMESKDDLDHVLFVFRKYKTHGPWGAISRSRDDGLHGRAPVFRSIRALVMSYFEPYVDDTGKITGFRLANLDDSKADWRWSKKNVWKAEKYLIYIPHKRLPSFKARYKRHLKDYLARGEMKKQKSWW